MPEQNRNKPILCLDFDGVLHSYKSGWKGAKIVADEPVPGALEFLCIATEYFQVCIYSSRSRQFGGKRAMKNWLWDKYAEIAGVGRRSWFLGPYKMIPASMAKVPNWYFANILGNTSMEPWEHEVDYGIKQFLKKIRFPTKKPAAFLTIDDRAITFNGEFPRIEEIKQFRPWNKLDV